MISKLDFLVDAEAKYRELNVAIADPDVIADQNKWRELMKEHARLEPIILCYHDYQKAENAVAESREMAQSARTLLAGGKAATAGVAGVALKASKLAGSGMKGVGAVGGFLANRIGLGDMFDAGQTATTRLAGNAAAGLTAQASAGSRINQILENAGIQKSSVYKNKNTGKFESHQHIADIIENGLKSKK